MLRALELIRNPCTLFTSGDVNSQGQFMNRFMYRFAGIIERTQCVREGVHGGVTMETLPDRAPVENYPNPIPEENATQLSPRCNAQKLSPKIIEHAMDFVSNNG